jgi:WD40 repeat protein
MVAGGYLNGTVQLWNVADPANARPVGPSLASGDRVNAIAFSPDGRTLAGASSDGITRLWNLNVQYAIGRICAAAGDLTPQQWHTYLSQLPYQPACTD